MKAVQPACPGNFSASETDESLHECRRMENPSQFVSTVVQSYPPSIAGSRAKKKIFVDDTE